MTKAETVNIRVYTGSNCGNHTIIKDRKEYLNTRGSHYQNKWVWVAEDGSEWTKVNGEWRNVVNITSHRNNTVMGKGIAYDRAYSC